MPRASERSGLTLRQPTRCGRRARAEAPTRTPQPFGRASPRRARAGPAGSQSSRRTRPTLALAPPAREQFARKINPLPPLFANEPRDLFERLAALLRRELDDHRQVDARHDLDLAGLQNRSEEHTSELQSPM